MINIYLHNPLNDSFLELIYTKFQTSSEAKLLLKFMGITALRSMLRSSLLVKKIKSSLLLKGMKLRLREKLQTHFRNIRILVPNHQNKKSHKTFWFFSAFKDYVF